MLTLQTVRMQVKIVDRFLRMSKKFTFDIGLPDPLRRKITPLQLMEVYHLIVLLQNFVMHYRRVLPTRFNVATEMLVT